MAKHVAVTLVPAHTLVKAGDTLPLAIHEGIDPGWHTYWLYSGDAGQTPDIEWKLPAGFTAGAIGYPAPEKMTEGPLATYGYQNEATLTQTIALPKMLPAGPLTLTADISLLVCKDICIPEEGTYSVTLNNGADVDSSAQVAAATKAVVDPDHGTAASYTADAKTFTLRVPGFDIDTAKPATILPADWGFVDNPAVASVAKDGNDVVITQARGDRPLAQVAKPRFVVAYTDSHGQAAARAVIASPYSAARQSSSKSGEGFFTALWLALLGGLVLNLMPCVFPVLSLKALKLVQLQGEDLKHARIESLMYTAGILVSFVGLALVLVALRAGGAHIGWGFQLQNPVFVLPLAWLLFLVGLNLSGFFEVTGRLANLGGKWVDGNGHAASFFTGVLAAVVASPCTAPFMGVAIGYALTQGSGVTIAIFAALGFGLALPFIALSFVPALRVWLPKPGAWMQTFRELLAFPLYLSAAWLVWVFSMQAGGDAVMIALTGAVLVTFALWLWAKTRSIVWRIVAILAVLAAFALLPLAGSMQKQAVQTSDAADWHPYTAADFATREQGNDPIFVDMSAAWCITCKVNENAVLHTPGIMKLFHQHHVFAIVGDWTNSNPEITDYLKHFGRSGVPLYIFYGARGANGQRPEPVVLPQLLTAGIVEGVVGQ